MEFEDFKKLPPIKKLDFILHHLNHDGNLQLILDIEESLGWGIYTIEIDKELNVIIDKLLRDGYILSKHVEEQNPPKWQKYKPGGMAYYISFEGRVLDENGGYTQKGIDDKHKKLKEDIKYYIPIGIALLSLIVSCLALKANNNNKNHTHHHCRECYYTK